MSATLYLEPQLDYNHRYQYYTTHPHSKDQYQQSHNAAPTPPAAVATLNLQAAPIA